MYYLSWDAGGHSDSESLTWQGTTHKKGFVRLCFFLIIKFNPLGCSLDVVWPILMILVSVRQADLSDLLVLGSKVYRVPKKWGSITDTVRNKCILGNSKK